MASLYATRSAFAVLAMYTVSNFVLQHDFNLKEYPFTLSLTPLYAAEQPQVAAPELLLAGTITSAKGQTLALIQTNNKTLKYYVIGDTLKGYKITAIKRTSVKLTKNAQHYILYLQEKQLAKDIPKPELDINTASQTELIIKRDLLNHIRKNHQTWINAVSLRLELKDGYVSGYLVESIRNIPFKADIGLKKGDLITAINGISISQPLLFAKTVNNLMNVSDIAIQVERNHRSHSLIFNIQD